MHAVSLTPNNTGLTFEAGHYIIHELDVVHVVRVVHVVHGCGHGLNNDCSLLIEYSFSV
jgi:hypothetical protein